MIISTHIRLYRYLQTVTVLEAYSYYFKNELNSYNAIYKAKYPMRWSCKHCNYDQYFCIDKKIYKYECRKCLKKSTLFEDTFFSSFNFNFNCTQIVQLFWYLANKLDYSDEKIGYKMNISKDIVKLFRASIQNN